MTRGVILYNYGTKMVARLLVVADSLREHWDGEVAIITSGPANGDEAGQAVAEDYGFEFLRVGFRTTPGKNVALLNKTLLHEVTPFDTSVLIDIDCLVRGDVTPIFEAAERAEFAIPQFADWLVKGKIRKRVARWEGILPPWMMDNAYKYPAAINCGVYGFTRRSRIMADWYNWAVQNRESWIPDETCVQAMLGSYSHELLPEKYNCSCRYGDVPNAVIIHYHGRKHCRFVPDENDRPTTEFRHHSELWWAYFQKLRRHRVMRKWWKSDRMLRKFVDTWDKARKEPRA